MNPKPTDPVPAYEELFEHPPENSRTGYSHVPDVDADLENQAHVHAHTHNYEQPQGQEQGQAQSFSAVPREHFHCETCDLQKERHEKRAADYRCCQTVSRTFLGFGIMFTLIMLWAIPNIASAIKKKND